MTAIKTNPTCPACNAIPRGIIKADGPCSNIGVGIEEKVNVYDCACGAVYSTEAVSYLWVKKHLGLNLDDLVDGVAVRYFDLMLSTILGIERFHGWVNEDGKLVQTG
jgi:hypothetical protein